VVQFVPEGPGLVLACSDGLWNYLPQAAKLAELAMPTGSGAWGGLQSAANSLCAVALEGGGHDNITVTLAAYPPVPAQPLTELSSSLAETIQVDRHALAGDNGGADIATVDIGTRHEGSGL
jgi:serine/threonine protein phosphatase PrpC